MKSNTRNIESSRTDLGRSRRADIAYYAAWPRLDLIPRARGALFDLAELAAPFTAVADTPCVVEHEDTASGFRLVRYLYQGKGSPRDTILLVPHFINRPYILDLYPGVSVVRHFCERGFEVYLIDWGYPSTEQAGLSLTEYSQYIQTALNVISRDHVNILGYCTGGIIALVHAALHPDTFGKLVLLATPVDFSLCDPRVMLGWLVDARNAALVFGNVPGEMINMFGVYMLATYFPAFLATHDFAQEMASYEAWRDLWRRARWVLDAPAVPLTIYIQLIDSCYKANLLMQNRLVVGSRRVDLRDINSPVLNVFAEYDHLVPPDSARGLREVYAGCQYEEIAFSSSHVGLSTSARAHRELWPAVCNWLGS